MNATRVLIALALFTAIILVTAAEQPYQPQTNELQVGYGYPVQSAHNTREKRFHPVLALGALGLGAAGLFGAGIAAGGIAHHALAYHHPYAYGGYGGYGGGYSHGYGYHSYHGWY